MGRDLIGDLERWLREARSDEVAAARGRQRWLRQQASEESTLAGALLDRAERGEPVVVQARGQRRHRGTVIAVANDFFALRTAAEQDVLLRYDAVAFVRPEPGRDRPGDRAVLASDRRPPLGIAFAEALAVVVADRPRVQVVTSDGSALSGLLVGVGADVVTLALDGDRAAAYVPLAAVAEVSITD